MDCDSQRKVCQCNHVIKKRRQSVQVKCAGLEKFFTVGACESECVCACLNRDK